MVKSPDEIRAGLDDMSALSLTLMFEAGGEPIEGQIAVACVIRNRVNHPKRFSDTYRAVCVSRSQFSCWWPWGGQRNYERCLAVASALKSGVVIPFAGLELSIFQQCIYVAEGVIGGQIRDRVKGATHYYAPAAMRPAGSVPSWARGLQPAAKVGSQLFFVAA